MCIEAFQCIMTHRHLEAHNNTLAFKIMDLIKYYLDKQYTFLLKIMGNYQNRNELNATECY